MRQRIIISSTTLLLTFFALAHLHGQDCKRLENGKYKVKPKTKVYKDYQLIINNNDFIIIRENGEQEKGKIKWTSNCIFVLNYEGEKAKRDTSNWFYKAHRGWGERCYQLNNSNSHAFRITWTGNLEIQLLEGRIKKI